MIKKPSGPSQRPLTPQDMEALKRSREKLTGGPPGPVKKPSGNTVYDTRPGGTGPGRGRGGMTPPPGMMYGPDDRLIPIPKKGGAGTGGGRGPTPIDSPKKGVKAPSIKIFGVDGKRIPDRKSVPLTGGGRGMKRGGMVKGKK